MNTSDLVNAIALGLVSLLLGGLWLVMGIMAIMAMRLRREYGLARPFLRAIRRDRGTSTAYQMLAELYPDKTAAQVALGVRASRLATAVALLAGVVSTAIVVIA